MNKNRYFIDVIYSKKMKYNPAIIVKTTH